MLSLAIISRSLAARQVVEAARPLSRGLNFWQRPAKWEGVRYADCRHSLAPHTDLRFNPSEGQYAQDLPRSTTVTINLPACNMPEAQRMYEWLCTRPDVVTKMYPETRVYARKGLQPSMRLVREGEQYFYCLVDWTGEPALPWAL